MTHKKTKTPVKEVKPVKAWAIVDPNGGVWLDTIRSTRIQSATSITNTMRFGKMCMRVLITPLKKVRK